MDITEKLLYDERALGDIVIISWNFADSKFFCGKMTQKKRGMILKKNIGL